MNTVERFNQLEIENQNICTLLNILEENDELENYLSRFLIEKIEFMEIPDSCNGFICVSSQDVKDAKQLGYKLINKDIFLLFGLTSFLKQEQLDFAKQICDKIKEKKYKDIGKNIIVQFQAHYFIGNMQNEGIKVIQL
ncbi:hypothetical protein [Vibrio parahaemolyticus]|uniref:hypothetical protein n=1 Tax=Vibrio parahaemolyticus TaxID=670 RepID=UPI0011109589|nr:hypothetical protein [Vibrio parahaemolyticus]TMX35040.1 hypothetical protein DA098_21405 [Vibrio parahaemolyticus]TMX78278.1 hypothetical protein DA094_11185 [Vibrio parahaemolyticus]